MPKLIGFVGKMGVGKTTAALALQSIDTSFNKVAFADSLKEKAMLITPDGKIDKVRDRELLQFLGTDYFRNKIDLNYWTNEYTKRVKYLWDNDISVVTDDVRFPNECALIKELGGKVVYLYCSDSTRMERLGQRDGQATEGIKGHASETLVDSLRLLCDYEVCTENGMEAAAELRKILEAA